MEKNEIKVRYVIKNFKDGKYISVLDQWDGPDMVAGFTREDAIEYIKDKNIECCIIEELINFKYE